MPVFFENDIDSVRERLDNIMLDDSIVEIDEFELEYDEINMFRGRVNRHE